MTKVIPRDDGDGNLYLSYEGSGAGTISITSDENEGIDRSQVVKFSNGSLTADLTVHQTGEREEFILADGEILSGSDKPFYTLKDGL